MFRLIRWYWRLRGNKIHHTAIIYPCVRMGKGNYIGPFCIIGAPPEYKGHEKSRFGVVIGDKNIITGHVTIDRGAVSDTHIQGNCYLMKHSHIAHDAFISDYVTMSCGAKVGGYCQIGRSTNMGLNSCVHQQVDIPNGCMLGMGTIFTRKTEAIANTVYMGVPAKPIRKNERHY